jgi:tryptophan-rich sensory protein
VRAIELVLAGLFALGGIRSLLVWSRRPIEGADPADHALFALFVTGRVGSWLAFGGVFAIYASSDARGRAAVDELTELRWFLVVPLVLVAMQIAAAYFLGRRRP